MLPRQAHDGEFANFIVRPRMPLFAVQVYGHVNISYMRVQLRKQMGPDNLGFAFYVADFVCRFSSAFLGY